MLSEPGPPKCPSPKASAVSVSLRHPLGVRQRDSKLKSLLRFDFMLSQGGAQSVSLKLRLAGCRRRPMAKSMQVANTVGVVPHSEIGAYLNHDPAANLNAAIVAFGTSAFGAEPEIFCSI